MKRSAFSVQLSGFSVQPTFAKPTAGRPSALNPVGALVPKRPRSRQSGAVEVAVVYLVAGLAAGVFLGNWRPLQGLMGKKPPVEQVQKLQADLEKARIDAKAKEAELIQAQQAERAKLESQVQFAQADNAAAGEALKRVPAEHKTAEVKFASAMTQRVSLKLARAIGQLPADQQAAMLDLVNQALSDKQAEVDEANRKLAERDAEFAIVSRERDTLRTETIPALKVELKARDNRVAAIDGELTTANVKVLQYAREKYQSDQAAHTFSASLSRMGRYITYGVGAWLFLALGLPAIVKHMETGRIKNLLRDVNGYALNPLTYHDAKKKIAAATPPPADS